MSPASPSPHLLELCNLTLGYERHPAVHHLSLPLPTGALVAIVGPNGAGKSTLVKALAGVLLPMQGQIKGLPTAPATGWQRWWTAPRPSYRIAYLPQQAEMDRQFPITVFDMVCMGLWHEVGALGRFSTTQQQRCEAALAQVGLSGFAHRTIGTLSGGQFQRALFARLLLQDAQLIVLDEPFVGVDTRTTRDLLALLHEWHAQGRTVVAVLHDMEQVRQHFPTTWLLARELVAARPCGVVLLDIGLPGDTEWQYAAVGPGPMEENGKVRDVNIFPWDGGFLAPHPSGQGLQLPCNSGPIRTPQQFDLTGHPSDGGLYTVAVNSYEPNKFGLYQMAGNVAEWTRDNYSVDTDRLFAAQLKFQDKPEVLKRYTPGFPPGTYDDYKIVKGGSWVDEPFYMQIGVLKIQHPERASSTVGFRPVLRIYRE